METKKTGAPESAPVSYQQQCKDTKHLADCQKVFDYFAKKTATRFECEVDTGIPRPYVCWYVRNLRLNGHIQILRYGTCPISRYKGVQFLTTNKSLFRPEVKQPSLFDELV